MKTKPATIAVTATALILTLTACTSPATTPTQTKTETTTIVQTADLTAKGVVKASVLISSGDIDAAVSEGLVTPAEVDAAQKAITEGTLQQWVDLAEAK